MMDFDDNTATCLLPKKNNTKILPDVYEGIPETLLLNLIAWIFLLLLFAVLRNRAWDYGRLALVQSEKWTQLFYGNIEDTVSTEEISADTSLGFDQGCCMWFPAIFRISRQKFFNRCGPDAVHYLSFQKHLLLLSSIITVIALCVVLPINFQGHMQGDTSTFGHTTISNLEKNSKWLWVHIILALCYVPLTIFVMRHCSSRIPATQFSSKTVMVTHLSTPHRNVDDIFNYFCILYQDINIKDVQLAYDIAELTKYEAKRDLAHHARVYCEMHNKLGLKVRPKGCYFCCPFQTVDALQFYTDEEVQYTSLVEQHRAKALSRPLGIAFVTVGSTESAQHIIKTFVPGTYREWIVSPAPAPSDIFWENLSMSSKYWYLKAVLINLFLFIVLFFLTTPAIIVNSLNAFYASEDSIFNKLNPIVSEFLPTLLLWTMSALLPVLVAYSDQWLSHWTRSQQNLAVMQKTYSFLLFMILILPSLGLMSAQAFVEWSLQSENRTLHWECVFLPDKGAFFVNYIITSAFIGTALELIRFPELAMYVWRLLWARSSAETVSVQKAILSEFPFGVHYAWMLLIYTVSTVYSLACPLVAPFSLLYLSLKHIVDRHNLYFAYKACNMSCHGKDIHASAVRMARVAVVLLQVMMGVFVFLKGGMDYMTVVMIIGFLFSCGIFFFISPFPSCMPSAQRIAEFPDVDVRYIAPVLQTSAVASETDSPVVQLDYGTSNFEDMGNRLIANGNN